LGGLSAPDHAEERLNASARAATAEAPRGATATALAGGALSANVRYVSMRATDQGSLVSSIAEWLLSLDMAQYTQRFVEDGMDLDVLGELTYQDFDRLGVSVGHRRKLLKALRELGGLAPPQVATATPVAPQHSAERRQVTVMFCDLGGSNRASAAAGSAGRVQHGNRP
jgi:hypothetical protein